MYQLNNRMQIFCSAKRVKSIAKHERENGIKCEGDANVVSEFVLEKGLKAFMHEHLPAIRI